MFRLWKGINKGGEMKLKEFKKGLKIIDSVVDGLTFMYYDDSTLKDVHGLANIEGKDVEYRYDREIEEITFTNTELTDDHKKARTGDWSKKTKKQKVIKPKKRKKKRK